ncbi:MAG: sigma-70 family RNA polymerase sigma factor, partial [Candidatus Firestonebacteria bacterium]
MNIFYSINIELWFFVNKISVFFKDINSSNKIRHDTVSDKELENKWREGDPACFDLLYEKYKKPIFSFAYRMLGDFTEAEDVFQEAFLRVYRTADKKEAINTEFSTWIYTIARNLCLNEIKRRKSHPLFFNRLFKWGEEREQTDDIAGKDDQIAEFEKKEEESAIKDAINKLPVDQREV